LSELVQGAKARKLTSCVMTFEPHPKELFAPAKAPPRILNLRDKLEAFAAIGIERVVVEHFNSAFAALTPDQFVKQILVERLRTRWILIGDDFCYGAKRAGNFASLKIAGERDGFEVSAMPTIADKQVRISSSALRAAIAQGDLQQANNLLGRPYCISGHVLYGRQLGRTLGFPTLNIAVANHLHRRQAAASGIFVVQVHGLGPLPLPGVASLGIRPTVEDAGRVLLETHVFDFKENVYGRIVKVELLEKIRDEAKYPDLSALQLAIQADAAHARHYFLKKVYV
jgi:riboflavin kinase/FMN adenylyltransferase